MKNGIACGDAVFSRNVSRLFPVYTDSRGYSGKN